jgi:hypothetical protein
VITAHVTNANGLEGPFAALKILKYGDQVIIHLGGMKYVYKVRETKLAHPYSTDYAFQSKQDAAYLTLERPKSPSICHASAIAKSCHLTKPSTRLTEYYRANSLVERLKII